LSRVTVPWKNAVLPARGSTRAHMARSHHRGTAPRDQMPITKQPHCTDTRTRPQPHKLTHDGQAQVRALVAERVHGIVHAHDEHLAAAQLHHLLATGCLQVALCSTGAAACTVRISSSAVLGVLASHTPRQWQRCDGVTTCRCRPATRCRARRWRAEAEARRQGSSEALTGGGLLPGCCLDHNLCAGRPARRHKRLPACQQRHELGVVVGSRWWVAGMQIHAVVKALKHATGLNCASTTALQPRHTSKPLSASVSSKSGRQRLPSWCTSLQQ
jgi:hypothetical protein